MIYMKNGKKIDLPDDIHDDSGIFEEIENIADVDLDDEEIMSKFMQADRYTDAIIARLEEDD